MGRKNRKKRVDGFLIPIPFIGAMVTVSALALVYVWLGCLCEAVGEEIQEIEAQQGELAQQKLNAELRWARVKSPHSIEIALERHGIAMDWPQAGQVVRLADVGLRQDIPEASAALRLAQLRPKRTHE